jgi:transglutaminase-like putative cysteine protease
MRLNLTHRTSYRFSRPLTSAIQVLRLTPSNCLSQTVLEWRIDVDCNARLRETRDGYGNSIHMLYVDEPVHELAITAAGRVITEDRAGVVEGLSGDLPNEVFLRPTPLTTADAGLALFADAIPGTREAPLELLHALNAELHGKLRFEVGATGAGTSAAEAYVAGGGVCQDFAHIFITAARLRGIPARYVSGHLFRRDGAAVQDAGHAWAEAWVPALGWVAFDPANAICADEAYVRVAVGVDYSDAAPNAGTRRGGGDEQMVVEVSVTQAAPRSQTQRQWQSQSGGSQSRSQGQSQTNSEPPRRPE